MIEPFCYLEELCILYVAYLAVLGYKTSTAGEIADNHDPFWFKSHHCRITSNKAYKVSI